MITVFGIKNCDSVKKARRWFEAHDCEYSFHDFRVDGISKNFIQQWLTDIDWEQLLNRRSTSWKKLTEDQRKNIDKDSAIALMLENPTLIKRPVVVNSSNGSRKPSSVSVGFNEAAFEQLL